MLPPRSTRTRWLVAALAAGLAAGCVPIGDAADSPPSPVDLAPRFEPSVVPGTTAPDAPSAAPTGSATPPPAADTPPPAGSEATPTRPSPPAGSPAVPTAAADPSPTPTPAPPPAGIASVEDAPDDRTLRPAGSPPWADLTLLTLERQHEHFVLTVTLASDAPTVAPDGDHTMNIASFYDLDGDGVIDVEVWANLADGGWGTAYFDNRSGLARFDAEDGIEADVVGGRLVVTFPATVVDASTGFRWAAASEYGTYAEIGTALAARDDAPDGDRPVGFPQG